MEMLGNFMCGFLGGIVCGIVMVVVCCILGADGSRDYSAPPPPGKVLPPRPTTTVVNFSMCPHETVEMVASEMFADAVNNKGTLMEVLLVGYARRILKAYRIEKEQKLEGK